MNPSPHSLVQRCGPGALCFVLGLLVLARSHRFTGTLLHGWDAHFYYSAAHSLVFDADLDITNNLFATPWRHPFDRDANGSFEAVPRRADGHTVNKYPLGLSLIEAPFLALGHGLR